MASKWALQNILGTQKVGGRAILYISPPLLKVGGSAPQVPGLYTPPDASGRDTDVCFSSGMLSGKSPCTSSSTSTSSRSRSEWNGAISSSKLLFLNSCFESQSSVYGTHVQYMNETCTAARCVAWWCNGQGAGLRLERSRVRLPQSFRCWVVTLGKLFTHTHTHTHTYTRTYLCRQAV